MQTYLIRTRRWNEPSINWWKVSYLIIVSHKPGESCLGMTYLNDGNKILMIARFISHYYRPQVYWIVVSNIAFGFKVCRHSTHICPERSGDMLNDAVCILNHRENWCVRHATHEKPKAIERKNSNRNFPFRIFLTLKSFSLYLYSLLV